MRYFENLEVAASEIKRDLMKAPVVRSTRVQHLANEWTAHEAMPYSYCVQDVPERAQDVVDLGTRFFPFWKDNADAILQWMMVEWNLRMAAANNLAIVPLESGHLHPALAGLKEGKEYSYYYPERMQGLVDSMKLCFFGAKDSRRAYWPIFNELDARRAHRFTRIPCSIGYHFAIRKVNGLGEFMHCTYVQRSADFDVFWLSDVWFASRLQRLVAEETSYPMREPKLEVGVLNHFILSFHSFDRGEEIY